MEKILISNLTNPTLLFFVLGILAVRLKSTLEIPQNSVKFISLYLLFSIGFKGGIELHHSGFSKEIVFAILFGVFFSILTPIYAFFILKRKLSVSDAAAIAASYGSVSAVTFVAAGSFLENNRLGFDGHMVAVMALMEAPAIIVGVLLLKGFNKIEGNSTSLRVILKHSVTEGSVLMLVGSLVIGLVADEKQAEGIKPFTTDIFKGFLAIFLLEMGMVTAKRFKSFLSHGWFVSLFGMVFPLFNGCMAAILSGVVTHHVGNRFMLAVLAASASYIAVPAAMKMAAPKADPGLYIPMALGVTFPFNLTVGMPLYFYLISG